MVLVLFLLLTEKEEYKVSLRKLKIDFSVLKKIILIGIPAGIQGMIVSLSNVIVMAYINQFGSNGVAGFSCSHKIDSFLGFPVQSLMLATTTFYGQNFGANLYDRAKKGVRASLVMSISIAVIMGVLSYIFSNQLIGIFTSDIAVIQNGSTILKIMCTFYIFLCFHQMYSAALRASGKSMIPW